MEKKRAFKKRALALCSALFLIFVLAVPAFADEPDLVSISGNLVFADGMDLSEYFVYGETYSVYSGSFAVYDNSGLVLSDCNSFYTTTGNVDGSTRYFMLAASSNDNLRVAVSVSSTFDSTFSSYSNRFIVFSDTLVSRSSPIYDLCLNCAAVTSTVTFSNPVVSNGNIVQVITGAFDGILSGFGSGTADFFETIFINNDGSLTTFATVGLILLGVGFAIGIARWVVKKVGQ